MHHAGLQSNVIYHMQVTVVLKTMYTCQSLTQRNFSRSRRAVAPKILSETAKSLPPSTTRSSIWRRSRNVSVMSSPTFRVLSRNVDLCPPQLDPTRAAALRRRKLYRGQESRQIRGRTERKAGPRHRTSCALGRVAAGLVPGPCAAWPTLADDLVKKYNKPSQVPGILCTPGNDACTR